MPTCSNGTSKPRRPKKSRPFRPTSAEHARLRGSTRRYVAAALMTFVLKLPHSPLSPVTTMTSVWLSAAARGPSSSGWIDGSTRAATLLEHALHLHGIGPGVDDALLRAAQLRRGDHLHRLRDLLRVLHRANAAAEVDQ